MKISKILTGFAISSILISTAFGYIKKDGVPNINSSIDTYNAVSYPVKQGRNQIDKIVYLLHNINQFDPSLNFEYVGRLLESDYLCKIGKETFKCNALQYYESTLWASNSVGMRLNNPADLLAILKKENKKFVFLNRINEARNADTPRNGKPYMKVYIDKDGYLNAEFTRLTGGTSRARTSEPIPTNEPVYIQANESGEQYEVGWKGINSGKTSFGKNSHQVAPVDSDSNSNPTPLVSLLLDSDDSTDIDLNDIYEGYKFYRFLDIEGYFWNTKIPMFANIDKKDLSNMGITRADTRLVIDKQLFLRVISDFENGTNYFKNDTLRIYKINETTIIADIRETL